MRVYLVWASRASLAVVLLAAWASAAAAQAGRVGGIVKGESGQPIKSAVVTAEFLDANTNNLTATTDEKGRFVMIGLRFGEWTFKVQAPGFMGQAINMHVRTGGINPPMTFALAKIYEPPSALGAVAPKDLQTELAAADSLYNNQRWDEAIAAYRAVLAQAPSLNVVNLQIAAAFRNEKEFDNAIGAYNALLKVEPTNSRARVGIAMASLDKGDLDTAETTLEQAAQADGAARDVLFGLGEVRLARSKTDEAATAFSRAAQVDPTWGKPQFALGRLAMAKGERDAARTYFQKVVDVDPMSPEAGQASVMLQQIGR